MKTCPKCGYDQNPDEIPMCKLCGDVFESAAGEVGASNPGVAAFTSDSGGAELAKPGDISLEKRDFASEISANRGRTLTLMFFFPLLIVAMGWSAGEWFGGYSLYGIIAGVGIAVIYMLVSWFAGDKMILGVSKARPADKVRDFILINVVEEMSIASGMPMPKVYVIETKALNAFATGRSPAHASVAVTRGLIKKLNREELQAVVAHEMGHVRNFDIRYAMLVAAMVGAIVLLADAMRRSWWWGGRSRRTGSGSSGSYLIIIAILLAILAPVFAKLLQMAISRTREYLADATAVELTRNPVALANALEKLDNHVEEIPLPSANRATQHLFIVNPLRKFGAKSGALMSTHPPLQERIRRVKAMT